MKQLLSLDSKLIIFLTKLFDFVGLNVMFMVCCLPVITIPAAWSALLTTKYHPQRQPDLGIYATFWKIIKEKWLLSLKVSLITLSILGLMVILPSRFALVYLLPFQVVGSVVTLILLTYQFILIGLYEMDVKTLLRNCGFLFMTFPVQTSLLIIINTLVIFLSVTSYAGILISVYVFLFGGFVGLAILNAKVLGHIIKQITND